MCVTLACSHEKKSGFTKKHVTNITYRHWGRGNYKIQLHYRFENRGDTINSCSELKNLSMWESSIYNVGDTILIVFNKDNVQETKFIKRTYNTRWQN